MDKIVKTDVSKVKKNLAPFVHKLTGKTFLVTGGAGFLGSWVCDVLNSLGTKIICLDNFSTGSLANIAHLRRGKNFKLIKTDVCSFTTGEQIDYIVHMASLASPLIYQRHPISTLDANVLGTRGLLELGRKNDIEGFLLASTSEIYGSPPDGAIPTPESYWGYTNPFGPRSMYDEAKRCAEAYCYSYFKKFGLPIRVARIFNTFGPRLDIKSPGYGRVVMRFIGQALENRPITIYGDGSQSRSFCYVTDTTEGLVRLLLTDGLDGEVVNIGNNRETSVLELAQTVKRLTGSSSEFTFHPLPPDDPPRRCPDLTRARRLLGYQPRVSLEQGLRRTIEWCKSRHFSHFTNSGSSRDV